MMAKHADTVSAADVRRAAMDLLARREHSCRELRDKLRRRFSDGSQIESEVNRLAAEGLQSDARFAESFLRQRIGRGQGPLRIRMELKQRGIEESQISSVFAAAAVNWLDIAAEALQRKFPPAENLDRQEKARRFRFLQYRGFSSEEIYQLLD